MTDHTFTKWLIDEIKPISESECIKIDDDIETGELVRGSQQNTCQLAVTIKDMYIHDNKKWFGEADIRLDALVVTGSVHNDDLESFYMPRTETFSRVKDGERLPIGEGGLLIYHGEAKHFLDIRLMVSRDSKDTDSLANLIKHKLNSEELKVAMGSLLGLAVASPQTASIVTALSGAAVLGEFACRILRESTGTTIGFYRNSHRQYSDNFGIGRHPIPPLENYRAKDLSFCYEITLEEEDPYAF